ncbi:hypothetical protein BGX38DRAFT_58411 [Terfezia claveryi]|nr:hypothetical protein BGX38DRAFT_58411 [Terfezia claveryi]
MPDRIFGKHKARGCSASTGGLTGADVSANRSPSRCKRAKKHHCMNSSDWWDEYARPESTAPVAVYEPQGVTAPTMDSLTRGNHSLANASNAQLGKHKPSKNTIIQNTGSKGIKKARKAVAEREAKAEMERLLDPHMERSHTGESGENLVLKSPKEKERKARKQEKRRRCKGAEQQQEPAAIVGATGEFITQGDAEEGQSSTVPSKVTNGQKREKRAARKARGWDRASHDIENPEAVQSSTEVSGIKSGALVQLIIGESSLYPSPIVKDASAEVPDIAQPPRLVSQASIDDNPSCVGFEVTKNPMMSSMEEAVRTEPFDARDEPTGAAQEGAQVQEGNFYKFPGPGEKHWRNLSLEQRMTKIDLNPVGSDNGRKRFIWAKVEDGPVYASIVDLSCSSEIRDMLLHWLQSRFVSRVPATDLGNTILAHTWKLLEFVLRDDKDKLDEIRTTFKYARRLGPRIQKWEIVQLKTEKTYTEIENLWGKNWKEQCVMETDIAGVRNVKWKHGIVKQVMKLASTAMERDIGRAEAWGLVLKEVLAKGERAAVAAEDVWVVLETLIER